MPTSVDEYIDTINAEQYVDLKKLRASARYGVPAPIRGEVWLYLLGVLSPDRTNEITSIRAKYSSYTTMDKSQVAHRVRLECTRYYTRRLLPYTRRRKAAPAPIAGQPPPPVVQQQPVDELMDIMAFTGSVENVLSAYLNRNRGVDYQLGLVPLVAPFVWTLKTEAGMYFCFESLMSIIDDYSELHPLPIRISSFLSLFRQFLPDLYNYFDEEEVDMREFAGTWLQWLFAKEMQIGMLMRLWDVYFSVPDPLELHPFICLAILTTCKEALEELDQSEIRSMLLSLPVMEIDRILVEAMNLRSAYQTKGERSKE